MIKPLFEVPQIERFSLQTGKGRSQSVLVAGPAVAHHNFFQKTFHGEQAQAPGILFVWPHKNPGRDVATLDIRVGHIPQQIVDVRHAQAAMRITLRHPAHHAGRQQSDAFDVDGLDVHAGSAGRDGFFRQRSKFRPRRGRPVSAAEFGFLFALPFVQTPLNLLLPPQHGVRPGRGRTRRPPKPATKAYQEHGRFHGIPPLRISKKSAFAENQGLLIHAKYNLFLLYTIPIRFTVNPIWRPMLPSAASCRVPSGRKRPNG